MNIVGRANIEAQEVVIEPHRGWVGLNLPELVRNRELLFFLIWRDVKAKYKQATLGFAWALFVPLLSMLIYTGFGVLANLDDTIGVPYALYILAGLIPWLFIQRSLSDGGMALVNQQSLLSKIYMPRLYLPTAACGNALVDLVISFALFTLLAVYFIATGKFTPNYQLLFLPLVLLLTLIAGVGIACLFSAMIVVYRDLKFVVPFFAQFGLWLSAVVVPPTMLGEHKYWLALNPLAGVVSAFRSCVLGLPWEWPLIASSAVFCPLLLVVAVFYFKRVERQFADIV
jgi:lipopolysaccharide transport system permease protein